ncbi:Propanediol utilization polyhedral body protein PduT [Klebsiella pneumoniae IS43]|uniref:Propanediol utilization polyhedral body protein PduT n=1 Tax=Klebsiella pneumoniae IS43 TaxID=1432552 RepID=W1DPV9_KLEPN|nr:Propanediol utilization polyhedral body protein PduT [Klebsiella pneumoniae IS43]
MAACISAADRAVKAANVTLVRVHMAFWYRRQMLHGGGG